MSHLGRAPFRALRLRSRTAAVDRQTAAGRRAEHDARVRRPPHAEGRPAPRRAAPLVLRVRCGCLGGITSSCASASAMAAAHCKRPAISGALADRTAWSSHGSATVKLKSPFQSRKHFERVCSLVGGFDSFRCGSLATVRCRSVSYTIPTSRSKRCACAVRAQSSCARVRARTRSCVPIGRGCAARCEGRDGNHRFGRSVEGNTPAPQPAPNNTQTRTRTQCVSR